MRQAGAVLAAGAVCVLLVFWVAHSTWRDARVADPVVVKVIGKLPANSAVVYCRGHNNDIVVFHPVAHTPFMYSYFLWIAKLYVSLPEKDLVNLESLEITLGAERRRFSRQEIENSWGRVADATVSKSAVLFEVPDEWGRDTWLPWLPRSYNWPGDRAFMGAVWRQLVGPLVVLGIACFLWMRMKTNTAPLWQFVVAGDDSAIVENQGTEHWNWMGWVALLLSLVFLEWRDPYYFTQDDNMDDILPMVLAGCRNLWQGYWPGYTPYVFLGVPLASQGMYALTYPPTLVSYAVARHILGNEFLTVEVFAVLHVLAAFWAVRSLGRKIGMNAFCANVTGLSVSLSGAVLILGRCWFNFTPTTLWLAVLFLGLIELTQRKVGWRWLLAMGLAAAMPFHVGFVQLALYTHALLGLAVLYLLATRALSWRGTVPLLAAWLVGAGLSVPIVFQQWQLSRGMTRYVPANEGIAAGWGAFYLPYPLIQADAPSGWGNIHREYMGSLYFAGGVLALCATLQLVGMLFSRPKRFSGLLWLFLAAITVWLALGESGGLWNVVQHLPIIGFVNRYPLRLLPFVIFFVSVAGGLVLQRLLAGLSAPRQRLAAAAVVTLLAWQVAQSRAAFFIYDAQPGLPLPVEFSELLLHQGEPTGRLISLAPERSAMPQQAWGLAHNHPAAYGIPAVNGYNSLLEGSPLVRRSVLLLEQQTVEALRAYGVAWYIVPARQRSSSNFFSSSWTQEIIPQHPSLEAKVPSDLLRETSGAGGFVVKKLENVDPLAFVAGSKRKLRLSTLGEGVDVMVDDLEGNEVVVINFLRWPNMVAALDGKELPCEEDEWGRIVVKLVNHASRLSIRYRPDWLRGIGLGVLGIGAGLLLFGLNRLRRFDRPEAITSAK